MVSIKLWIALFLFILSLLACGPFLKDRIADPKFTSEIVEHQTTQKEISQMFGEPDTKISTSIGDTWTYTVSQDKKLTGIQSVASVLLAIYPKELVILSINFDSSGVVNYKSLINSNYLHKY